MTTFPPQGPTGGSGDGGSTRRRGDTRPMPAPRRRGDTKPYRMPVGAGPAAVTGPVPVVAVPPFPAADEPSVADLPPASSRSLLEIAIESARHCVPTCDPLLAGARAAAVLREALRELDVGDVRLQEVWELAAHCSAGQCGVANRTLWHLHNFLSEAQASPEETRLARCLEVVAEVLLPAVEAELHAQFAETQSYLARAELGVERRHRPQLLGTALFTVISLGRGYWRFRRALYRFHNAMTATRNHWQAELRCQAADLGLCWEQAETILGLTGGE